MAWLCITLSGALAPPLPLPATLWAGAILWNILTKAFPPGAVGMSTLSPAQGLLFCSTKCQLPGSQSATGDTARGAAGRAGSQEDWPQWGQLGMDPGLEEVSSELNRCLLGQLAVQQDLTQAWAGHPWSWSFHRWQHIEDPWTVLLAPHSPAALIQTTLGVDFLDVGVFRNPIL